MEVLILSAAVCAMMLFYKRVRLETEMDSLREEICNLSEHHLKEVSNMRTDMFDLTQLHLAELEAVRAEMKQLTSIYCDLDKRHLEEIDRIHVHYAEEFIKLNPDLFDDCFALKNATLENLYDALEIVMNHPIQLPLDKNHLIKMYLTEVYRRGMWVDTLEWWKYDTVTCIACMKQDLNCVVCSPNRHLPPEEYNIIREMIVQDQWHEMLRKLKPLLKERRDQLKQLKQHALKML
jgi:hypothetical protein